MERGLVGSEMCIRDRLRYYGGYATTLATAAGGYFSATPPTDYTALNQDNLATNTAGITGFSRNKNRDAADNHILSNRVRGVGRYFESDNTAVEEEDTNTVKRFLQQGVQIGNMDAVNTANESFVLWQWVANGTGTANSDGAIAGGTTISANTTAGFVCGTYTGTGSATTIGHGLGATPKFFFVKRENGTNDTATYHAYTGGTKYLAIDSTMEAYTGSTVWNNTDPTSSVISIGSSPAVNNSGDLHMFFAWAEVEGYSKFGSYVGNSDPDGPYVNLGFKPAYLLIKKSSAGGTRWIIVDSARDPYNPTLYELWADGNNAESTASRPIDLLSNGFKLRASDSAYNSGTFIYAAFAEHPVGGSGVAQAKAR